MGEFRVSDKEPTKKSSTNTNTNTSSVVGSGVKVQNLEEFPNKIMMMMMQHHNHHHRPFDNDDDDAGPTTYMSSFNNHINVVSGASSAPLGAAAIHGHGGASPVIRPLQPFDISSAYTPATTTTTLKSPAGGSGMAASFGFPFTGAQRKELQRQAIIYKYMMASVPVPPDLLIPTTTTTTTTSLDGGFNLRLSTSSSDPEPGRCRRTDGKKWRCSRDVAPNHKYCERHMHRGRPRSRKPVEVHPNNNPHQIKRARHDSNPFPVGGNVAVAATPNPTTTKDRSSSHFLEPYLQSPLSLDNNNFGVKATNFGSLPSVSSNKQPRGLEWMLNGDPISLGESDSGGWQSLIHNKVAMSIGGSCHNNAEPQYLNSLALHSPEMDQQDRRLPMFLNPSLVPMQSFQSEKPRGFIDAWSNSEAVESSTSANTNTNTNNKDSAASIGKLSLSSLDLSMGGGAVHEDMGTIGMGLGLMEPDGNTNDNDDTTKISLSNWLNPAPWVASTPGGPLAEVLRPTSTVTPTSDATSKSDQSSPVITRLESSGPLGRMASSPSGVLHKTFASLSDSSSNSSPTVASSSRANFDETALLKFNQM